MSTRNKILVLGSTGFLGTYFSKYSSALPVSRSKAQGAYLLNLIDSLETKANVYRLLESVKPNSIVNCIALTSIEKCEHDPIQAQFINSEFPGIVADIAGKKSIPYVHFSTDAVFNGLNSPYVETDEPSPISVYGKTKLLGENNVIEANPNSLILRTNFFGYSFKRLSLFNFFFTHLLSLQECLGYTDVAFTPMYVKDVCAATFALLDKEQSGIFHLAGVESVTKFDFGRKVAQAMEVKESLVCPSTRPQSKENLVRSYDLRLESLKLNKFFKPTYSLIEGIVDSLSEVNKEQNGYLKN